MTVYNYNELTDGKQQHIGGVVLRRIDGSLTQPAAATAGDVFKIATGLSANTIFKSIRLTSAITGATSVDIKIFRAGEDEPIDGTAQLAKAISLASNANAEVLGSGVTGFDRTINLQKLAKEEYQDCIGYDVGIVGNTLGSAGGTYRVEMDLCDDL
jgi:hypothetical protein